MFYIEIITILILILFLSKHSLCHGILEQGLLLFQDKENVLHKNNSNPYSDIISIQNILFVLEYQNRDYYYSMIKRMFCIETIAILILILFLYKTFSLSYNRNNQYSRTKRMFWIEIIAILILILFLSKHSLCPRIILILF